MLLRTLLGVGVSGLMMCLVVLQISVSEYKGWLTVEQIYQRGERGLTFDRHYAMPFDFCIIAPFVGLVIFLCMPQWTWTGTRWSALSSVAVATGLVAFWYNLPGKEAHNQSLVVAIYHGIFLAIALWAVLMVDVFTPNPQPVLLLVMCIILPAFLFVGTHMYLGLINTWDTASTYPGNPLKDPVGWAVIIAATGLQCWRAYVLIPTSFWDSIR